MENVNKILELDISDKKKAKLIESYLEKLEYPVIYPNITWTYPYIYDQYPFIYGPITCGSSGTITHDGPVTGITLTDGSITTSTFKYGISTE